MVYDNNIVSMQTAYGFADIDADSPVLFEILTRYREKGAFRSAYGETVFAEAIGTSRKKAYEKGHLKCPEDADDTPIAYSLHFNFGPTISVAPKKISRVAKRLLDLIEVSSGELINKDLFEECAAEIAARESEITAGYRYAHWAAGYDPYPSYGDEDSETTIWEFRYDGEHLEKHTL